MSVQTPPAARFWRPGKDGSVDCFLCPRRCQIAPGETGFCAVRHNEHGTLRALAYGRPSAVHVDPIEKKPFYHFLPGSTSLSLGTVGCNLDCQFCQNCSLSRARFDPAHAATLSPGEAVLAAQHHGCQSLSYTYNEPTVFVEFAQDTAALAREAGLGNCFVTNGYVSDEVLEAVYANLDAANVDLKSFAPEFYRRLTGGRLRPVLNTLTALKQLGVWVEVTTLLIPGLNDSADELRALCQWVGEHLGDRTPLHFSAFHPDHRLLDVPATPPDTLRRARELALEAGLRYVYLGNVLDREGGATRCPDCGEVLVTRSWHSVQRLHLDGARCAHCGAAADFVLTVGETDS